MIKYTENSFNACPFCGGADIKCDKAHSDRIAFWCARCGAGFERPQGKSSFFEVADKMRSEWCSRPIENALRARIKKLKEIAADTISREVRGCPNTIYGWSNPRYSCDNCDQCNAETVGCWMEWIQEQEKKQ